MAAQNLDTTWIDDYEDIEKKYEMFYKENISSMNVIMIYVNNRLEIEKISQRDLELKSYNVVSKDEILEIINSHSCVGNIKYRLLSLLTYNINITHNELKGFLNSDLNTSNKDGFLHSLSTLQDIRLNPSIQLFNDINSVIIVYYEKPEPVKINQKEGKTKHNTTKKIFINTRTVSNKQKKTKRHYQIAFIFNYKTT